VDEKSESFDIVLSTQVLEHVQQPGTYLSEAYRLLKPGGVFICTTHGTYEEHGCPHDFHRWTADGLREEIAGKGFVVDKVIKMTTGPRAVMFLMELYRHRFNLPGNDQFGNFVMTMLGTIHQQQSDFHRWSDEVFDAHRITDSFEREHAFYIALMAVAHKPETGRKEFVFRRHSIPR
jgi:SAM-dependent methyltransferase